MTDRKDGSEHFFIAYNESLTVKKGEEKTRIVRDFKHIVSNGKESVEIEGELIPFPRVDFPFSLNDIEFTRNVENEILVINRKEQCLKIVQHIQIGDTEYVLLDGEYKEFDSLKIKNSGTPGISGSDKKKNLKIWENKKLIIAASGVVLILMAAVFFIVFAGAPPSREKSAVTDTSSYAPPVTSEPIPEPTIPGYVEKTYSWWYNDRADRLIWRNPNAGRTYSMTLEISKNSYYRSKEADHSSRSFSTYVNDTLNQETMKQVGDKIIELGKKYGFGDFENVMNAASFVQDGLPYTEDKDTTGYEDYWRYPVETLVDGGGDCEDSAILLASILQNMGYEVIVLGMTDHAAIAIKGVKNPVYGDCAQIEYNGDKYLYLETTDTWEIGNIPYEEYGVTAYVDFA